jgi:two-component system sensor histidine kinase/response regulator
MPDHPFARILIVDDEAHLMAALCDTLREYGYETTGYSSSTAALAALTKSKFDLLLTDLMMPEMDGIALLRAAHEIDGDLVGVMMTGHGAIDTAIEAMKAGALDYILKPSKLSVMLPVLSRALTVQRLRRENGALQRRVRERTTELEAANKELEAFSYSVSHDLRAPLRHIDGFSHRLEKDYGAQLPPTAQHLLQRVCNGAQRLGLLIDALLNLARFSRHPLAKRTINLATLVQQVLSDLEGEREGRQVDIKLGHLPDCLGDASLLRQVFMNLLSNALKFTRRREKAFIEIECQEQSGELVCTVRDNGAGFDMQTAGKLFGVFQRLHRADQFEGTGVGLSIVHRIIERHGGRVWAEAELDKGATFHFTLPLPSQPPTED